MASTAKISVRAPASANQTYQASLTSQDSKGTNSARPNASPHANEPRRLRPVSATTSSAGPSTTSGQAPTGGKEAYSARPPATDRSSAHHMPNPPKSPPRPVRAPEAGTAWAEITVPPARSPWQPNWPDERTSRQLSLGLPWVKQTAPSEGAWS